MVQAAIAVNYLTISFAFMYGLVIGSFLNVCIHRIPGNSFKMRESRSRCPDCKEIIRYYDNIPLVSYILLLGRCRHCKKRISPRYPLVELVSGLFAVSCLLKFGITWAALVYYILIAALIVITFIDLDHMIIPDVISLPGIPIGVAASFLLPVITLKDSLLGLVLGAGGLFLISEVFWLIRRKEGMGMGDMKLLGMLGTFIGWKGVLFTIMAGSFVGMVAGVAQIPFSRDKTMGLKIPFGPFLAAGAIIYIFWGDFLIQRYLDYARYGL